MIFVGVKVFFVSYFIDFCKGLDSLLLLVCDVGSDFFNGLFYVFWVKWVDCIKIVWWDVVGGCFYFKWLEKVWFCWLWIGYNWV